MIRRLKKNEYEIKRALSIKHMIQDIEASYKNKIPDPSLLDAKKLIKDCCDNSEDGLISIKTKKHKSLGVLCLVFIKLFFEKARTLTIEEVVQFLADCEKESNSQ